MCVHEWYTVISELRVRRCCWDNWGGTWGNWWIYRGEVSSLMCELYDD